MKIIHRDNYKNYIICLIALILSAISFPYLPEEIPIHFNAQGIPDGFGSPLTIFLLPAIMILVNVFAEFTKHADPKAANYTYFSGHYYQLFLVLNIFFLLVQLYIITYALEIITFDITNVILVALGILFVVIGNLLPKVKQNFFMGIKTPWALADEYVWYETHRFSGKLWFGLGLIMCVGGFLPGKFSVYIVLGAALIGAIVPMVYSYLIYKKRTSK